jgi:RimJ/RimL family protein N-acetyltransferase
LIKNTGLFITEYNDGDDPERAVHNLREQGLECCEDPEEFCRMISANDENRLHSFAFTDNRAIGDRLRETGVGFAAYLNPVSRGETFSDTLYMIDNICNLKAFDINRFLLRYLHLPWDIIETKRCLVREITEEDVDELYEIYADPGVSRYTEGLYEDREREREYIRDYIKNRYRFFEYGIWLIIDRASKKVIGRAGFEYRAGFEDPELGYVIAAPCQRKGYAFEVCSALLKYAADQLAFSGINAFTVKENTASVRLLRKLGFERMEEIMIDGKAHERYNIKVKGEKG